MKLELEFECTCSDGKCVWKETPYECISMDDNEEGWVCWYLRAKAKVKKD